MPVQQILRAIQQKIKDDSLNSARWISLKDILLMRKIGTQFSSYLLISNREEVIKILETDMATARELVVRVHPNLHHYHPTGIPNVFYVVVTDVNQKEYSRYITINSQKALEETIAEQKKK
ncbi:MAG TPA: hypothetical protein VLI92_05235 [Candidatus Saccharimonadales bacterium]|nr:hypothetical protein [Candidatus Saccharimonadales bacterium]